MEEINLTEQDLAGGLTEKEFYEVLSFVKNLSPKEKLTDEQKVVSEILFSIATKPHHGYDYSLQYHRRLGFIKDNKDKILKDEG